MFYFELIYKNFTRTFKKVSVEYNCETLIKREECDGQESRGIVFFILFY